MGASLSLSEEVAPPSPPRDILKKKKREGIGSKKKWIKKNGSKKMDQKKMDQKKIDIKKKKERRKKKYNNSYTHGSRTKIFIICWPKLSITCITSVTTKC